MISIFFDKILRLFFRNIFFLESSETYAKEIHLNRRIKKSFVPILMKNHRKKFEKTIVLGWLHPPNMNVYYLITFLYYVSFIIY